MVKNTHGGCNAKKFARKDSQQTERAFLRTPECDEEIYACVTKLNGNTCNVTTIDGTQLLAHIRNKFSGRNKRSNVIATNTVLLIGLREWESTKRNCDVLEVYSAKEVEQLRHIPKLGIERLTQYMTESNGASSRSADEDIVFSSIASAPAEVAAQILPSGGREDAFEMEEQEEINIDDI